MLQLAAPRTLALVVEVGGTTIVVPELYDYENVGDGLLQVSQLAATLTPSTNRLLAVLASEQDVAAVLDGHTPTLPRYIVLQVSKQIEDMNISPAQFAQLRDRTRQQQAAAIERMTRTIGPFVGEASGELSRQLGKDLELVIDESVPLGVFLDQDDAIGFAMITRSRISADSQESSYLVIATTVLINVRNKVLFAYIFSEYEDDEDIAWARATSRCLVEEIGRAN